jgi:hypothetical protein
MTNLQFDEFTLALLDAALWSSTDDDGEPLDEGHDIADIDEASLVRLMEDCERFRASPAWQAALADGDPRADRREGYDRTVEESGGYDFWLTRCGHGAGFWDGDWKEPHASALDALSRQFGNVDLYVADDRKIYAADPPKALSAARDHAAG